MYLVTLVLSFGCLFFLDYYLSSVAPFHQGLVSVVRSHRFARNPAIYLTEFYVASSLLI